MNSSASIVTIDGPSGAGKSTISRMLAERLNFTYLDTGAMYRAVGFLVQSRGILMDDGQALAHLLANLDLNLIADGGEVRVILNGEDISAAIRTAEMALVASRVSAHPAVRAKLTALQRQIGSKDRVVAEGRDMGTVVFPQAEHKFYLDATADERARRRVMQLREKGEAADEAQILNQILKRDQDDSSRALAPLKPADDAVIVDSSKMNVDEVVGFMLKCIKDDFDVNIEAS